MKSPLTPRQAEVLSAILEGIRKNGYPPTYRELCPVRDGVRSRAYYGPFQVAARLERLGYIWPKASGGASRSLRPARDPLGRLIFGFSAVVDPRDVADLPREGHLPFLEAILDSIARDGSSPTLRELGARFGMTFRGAMYHLRPLIAAGYLRRAPNVSAGLTPLRDASGRRIVEFAPVYADTVEGQ